jgi:hypothetical protein
MEKKPKPTEESLSAAAEGWLANLPDDVRPKLVQEKYPRIVNRMASLWRHPDDFMSYVDGLLVDQRGGRAGFPMTVALELATIKDHYELNVHPERTKAYLWDPRQKGQ